MGYLLQPGAPQCTVGLRTVAVGAFVWISPMGSVFKVGAFELDAAQGWISIGDAANYANPGDCLADVQAKGGIAAYMTWAIAQLNARFAAAFPNVPPAPPGEPTTDHDAIIAIQGGINALAFTAINGVPTLHK